MKRFLNILKFIVLFSIIGGIVKYSLRYIDDNPDYYIPKKEMTFLSNLTKQNY